MQDNVFEYEKEITSIDVDFNLDMKLSSLFIYFQEIACLHAEKLGVGNDATIEKDLHWIITRFNLEINRMPKYGDKVIFKTYPGNNNNFFYYRHFIVADKKDNVLVKANSVWAVIDGKTRQVKRDPFNGYSLPICSLEGELDNPGKIRETATDYLFTKKIRYSDIDLNTHLNNTRYIELIQDAFDLEFYKTHKIKSFSINYNAEFKVGDEVSIYTSNSNPVIVSGRKDDKEHFVASLEFKKI